MYLRLFLCLQLCLLSCFIGGNLSAGDDLRGLFDQLTSTSWPNQEDLIEIDGLIDRYQISRKSLESCPLSSKNYEDIAKKIKTIAEIFKNKCAAPDSEKVNQLVSGADEFGSLFSASNGAVGPGTVTSITADGMLVASILDGLNNFFSSNECKVARQRVLVQVADVIQAFSLLGLLSSENETGVVFASGGIAFSALLKLIDSFLTAKPRFSFDLPEDRQVFIRLNCGFYDLRRELYDSGAYEYEAENHREDLDRAKSLHEKLIAEQRQVRRVTQLLKQGLAEKKFEYFSGLKEKNQLKTNLAKIRLNSTRKIAEGIEGEVSVREITAEIAAIADILIAQIDNFNSAGRILNDSFIHDLRPFSLIHLDFTSFNELVVLNNREEFNKKMANLAFHSQRLGAEVETQIKDREKEWPEQYLEDLGLTVGEVHKQVEQVTQQRARQLDNRGASLDVVTKRIAAIVDRSRHKAIDDGTENLLTISHYFDQIQGQIYGKWGHRFVRNAVTQADRERKRFSSDFNRFMKRNGQRDSRRDDWRLIALSDFRDRLEVIKACQDALDLQKTWALAQSFMRQSSDFLMTNQDLLHQNTRRGFFIWRTDYERLRQHYRSDFYARVVLDGDEIERKERRAYIERRYGGFLGISGALGWGGQKLTGGVMLEMEEDSSRAKLIQEAIESYQCHRMIHDQRRR